MQEVTLPVRYGGSGLISTQRISRCAFVSSWVQSLPDRFVGLQPQIDQVLSLEGKKDSISHTLQKSLDTNQSLAEYLSNTKKLQYRLVDKAMKAQVDKMLECSLSNDAARLRSLQGKGEGAWLNSIPSSKKLALSPGNFILAASLRLGLAMPLPRWADSNCECGKKLDPDGYHLLTCKVGCGPVWFHNCMVSAWSQHGLTASVSSIYHITLSLRTATPLRKGHRTSMLLIHILGFQWS